MEDFLKERGIADEVIQRFIKEKVIKFLNCSKTFRLGKGTFTCKKTPKKPPNAVSLKKIALKMKKCLIMEYIIVEILHFVII